MRRRNYFSTIGDLIEYYLPFMVLILFSGFMLVMYFCEGCLKIDSTVSEIIGLVVIIAFFIVAFLIIPLILWILDHFDETYKKKEEKESYGCCSYSCSCEEFYRPVQNGAPVREEEDSYDFYSDKELSFLLDAFDKKTDSKKGQKLYNILSLLHQKKISLPEGFRNHDLTALQESLEIFLDTPKDVSKEIRKDMEENVKKSIDSIYGEAKEILDRYYETKNMTVSVNQKFLSRLDDNDPFHLGK